MSVQKDQPEDYRRFNTSLDPLTKVSGFYKEMCRVESTFISVFPAIIWKRSIYLLS